MSTPPPTNPPDHEHDRDPIAQMHHALVDDLATTLDLDAGAAEATQPHHYTHLTADLHETLDLDAGLAAIVGGTESASTAVASPSDEGNANVGALPPASSWVSQFADHLRRLDPPARLAVRTLTTSRMLGDALDLALTVGRVRVLAQRVTIQALEHRDVRSHQVLGDALPRARNLNGALALAVSCARALLGLDIDRVVDHELDDDAVERALASTFPQTLDHNLALLLGGGRDDARDLALVLALAPDLDEALDLDDALDLDSVLLRSPVAHTRVLARAYDDCCLLVDAATTSLAHTLGQSAVGNSPTTRTTPTREIRYLQQVLEQVMTDFVGADLRSAMLDEVSLEGIRWSASTRWPAGWAERIRAASVEVEPGIFEIRGQEPGLRAAHTVTT